MDGQANPKAIMRRVCEVLPPGLNVKQRFLVQGLWAHSDEFLTEDALELGRIKFSGSVSFQQLADFCGIGYSTVKKHLNILKDRQIVNWTVGRRWVDFTVSYNLKVATSIATSEVVVATDESMVATDRGPGSYVVATDESMVATGVATLSLNSNCRLSHTGTLAVCESTTSKSQDVRETLTHPAGHSHSKAVNPASQIPAALLSKTSPVPSSPFNGDGVIDVRNVDLSDLD